MTKILIEGAGLDAIIRDTTKKRPSGNEGATDKEIKSLKEELEQLKKKVDVEAIEGQDRKMLIDTLKKRAEEFDDGENLLDAFHLYRRVLRLAPDDVEALYQLATMYYSADMREKAMECLYAILEIDPDHKRAAENLEELKGEYQI